MALTAEDKEWIREAIREAIREPLSGLERRIGENLLDSERRINANTADHYNSLKKQVEKLQQDVAKIKSDRVPA